MRCKRCERQSSWLNEEGICPSCEEREQQTSFEQAVEAELINKKKEVGL
jgi:Zn finger protein HypA/HybF involved in hydrogenase expression